MNPVAYASGSLQGVVWDFTLPGATCRITYRPAIVATLNYAHLPKRPWPKRNIVVWLLGTLPSLVLAGAVFDNIATGDPVDSVTRFTAYHWISGAIVLSLIVWLIAIVRASAQRSQWVVCLFALLWFILNIYGVYLFIHDVRTDAASSYYFSIWRPFGWR